MRTIAAVTVALALAVPVRADVAVIDGDTVKVDRTTYRLWGIDAPEYRQSCDDAFASGGLAFDVLRQLVRGKKVECELRSKDGYGRTVAVWRADGLDLASIMVRAGWAWAFLEYSTTYPPQELQAKAARVGEHGHDSMPAWEWRRRQSDGREGTR